MPEGIGGGGVGGGGRFIQSKHSEGVKEGAGMGAEENVDGLAVQTLLTLNVDGLAVQILLTLSRKMTYPTANPARLPLSVIQRVVALHLVLISGY